MRSQQFQQRAFATAVSILATIFHSQEDSFPQILQALRLRSSPAVRFGNFRADRDEASALAMNLRAEWNIHLLPIVSLPVRVGALLSKVIVVRVRPDPSLDEGIAVDKESHGTIVAADANRPLVILEGFEAQRWVAGITQPQCIGTIGLILHLDGKFAI